MALDRLTKVDGGGISTTSDYRVGIITASKFVGPFDGTGGNFSGVVTATNGVFSGNISAVDGNFSGNVTIGGTLTYEDVTNIDSVGIITARNGIKVSTGTATTALVVDGDARVTGILTVGTGSLTLDGPNNLVNVGTALTLGHSQGVQFHTQNLHSAGFEVNQINASGIITASSVYVADSIIHQGDTDTKIEFATNQIKLTTANKLKIDLTANGFTYLRGTSISEATSTYPKQAGSNYVHRFRDTTGDNTEVQFFNTNVTNTILAWNDYGNSTTAGNLVFKGVAGGSGLEHARFTGSGNFNLLRDLDVDGHTNLDNVSIAGVTTFASGNVQLASDSQRLQLGSGQDLWMYHTGTSGGGHALIQNDYGTMYMLSDNFTFRDRSTNHDVFKINENNAVSLYYQNNAKLSSTSYGAQIDTILRLYGAAGTGGGRLRLAEGAAYSEIRGVRNTDTSSELWFGTEIGDTVDYRAKINTGGHFIPGTDSDYDLGLTGTRWRNVYADTLYGDGSNLTGITQTTINNNTDNYVVTATGTANTLQGEANLIYNGTGLGIGETSPANLLHVKVSDAGITPHSSAQIVLERVGTNYLQFLTGINNTSGILFGDTNDIDVGKLVYDHNLGDMQFQTEATVRMALTGTGDLKLPDNGAMEFGGSLTSGSGDLRIYHQSSDNNSYIVEGGTGSLMIQGDIINIGNVGSSKYYIRCFEDGAVQLRYGNNLTKLATTATGIEVTGEVAATQDYPIVKPILNWNFAATKTLDPRIQFRRNGTGTFIDEKGIVQYAGNNKPRFDHHPTSGASLGLLLEKSSTNYQEYSTLMSEANNKNNITVSDNFAISPDGTQNASKIVNATSSNAQTNIGWNGTSVANGSYSNWSIFVKSEETSCIIQIFSNTYIFGADRVNIELADGTYGGDTIDSTFRWIIEKYPNKWWRISVSGNGVGAAGGWYVGVVDSKSAARGATCGSATNKTWFAWGVQEEISTDRKFATSYIPTYGVSMNRGADDAEVLGDDFDDFFDRYQGTVIHEFSNAFQYWAGGGSGWEFNNDNYQYNCITQISSGYSHNGYPGAYAVAHGESSDSGSNSMSLFGSNSSPGNSAHQNGYYAGRYPNSSTPDSARFYKTYTDGMSWDVSGSTNYIRTGSGGFSTTGTNTNVISYRNISKLAFGAGANDMDGSYQRFNGRIKNWMYYDKALSASQLATMTAQHPVTYL